MLTYGDVTSLMAGLQLMELMLMAGISNSFTGLDNAQLIRPPVATSRRNDGNGIGELSLKISMHGFSLWRMDIYWAKIWWRKNTWIWHTPQSSPSLLPVIGSTDLVYHQVCEFLYACISSYLCCASDVIDVWSLRQSLLGRWPFFFGDNYSSLSWRYLCI